MRKRNKIHPASFDDLAGLEMSKFEIFKESVLRLTGFLNRPKKVREYRLRKIFVSFLVSILFILFGSLSFAENEIGIATTLVVLGCILFILCILFLFIRFYEIFVFISMCLISASFLICMFVGTQKGLFSNHSIILFCITPAFICLSSAQFYHQLVWLSVFCMLFTTTLIIDSVKQYPQNGATVEWYQYLLSYVALFFVSTLVTLPMISSEKNARKRTDKAEFIIERLIHFSFEDKEIVETIQKNIEGAEESRLLLLLGVLANNLKEIQPYVPVEMIPNVSSDDLIGKLGTEEMTIVESVSTENLTATTKKNEKKEGDEKNKKKKKKKNSETDNNENESGEGGSPEKPSRQNTFNSMDSVEDLVNQVDRLDGFKRQDSIFDIQPNTFNHSFGRSSVSSNSSRSMRGSGSGSGGERRAVTPGSKPSFNQGPPRPPFLKTQTCGRFDMRQRMTFTRSNLYESDPESGSGSGSGGSTTKSVPPRVGIPNVLHTFSSSSTISSVGSFHESETEESGSEDSSGKKKKKKKSKGKSKKMRKRGYSLSISSRTSSERSSHVSSRSSSRTSSTRSTGSQGDEDLKKKSSLKSGKRRLILKEQTLLIIDIEDFHVLIDTCGGPDILLTHSKYIEECEKIIRGMRGVVHTFMGDKIIASFNCTKVNINHEVSAARAAVRIRETITGPVSSFLGGKGLPELKVNIGIISNYIYSGHLGSRSLKRYSHLGRSINKCFALTKIGKVLGCGIVCDSNVYRKCKYYFDMKQVDIGLYDGEIVPLFNLMGSKNIKTDEWNYEIGEMLQADSEVDDLISIWTLYQERQFEDVERKVNDLEKKNKQLPKEMIKLRKRIRSLKKSEQGDCLPCYDLKLKFPLTLFPSNVQVNNDNMNMNEVE